MGKFLLVVVVFAALVYLTVRVIQRRGVKPAPRRPEPRVMGPDDDPDFLWRLDREKRRPRDQDDPADPEGPSEKA